MRFAGRVSADKISVVKVGQSVNFRINGYGNQDFQGKVTRVDPSANDVTRQVEVLVSFGDGKRPEVAGLYAEGNIEAAKVTALTLPESVLIKAGDKTSVWQVKNNAMHRVELVVGPRDARTGYHEVRSGLSEGDVIVRSPGSGVKEGQAVEMLAVKPLPSASAAQGS
jgi:multidrug efflux pump subunit AcrA (membrane-fusion protein)